VDFEFTDDQLDLRSNVRSVLESACPPALVRSVFEGTGDGRELWATLVGLDWPALGIAEEHGGLGMGYLEVGIVVEELGRVVAPSPFLATVTQLTPLLREAGATERLPAIAAGTTTGALAIAERGEWRLDAVRTTAVRTGDGWVLDG
jgi:acyl-CoA dehydrogenase